MNITINIPKDWDVIKSRILKKYQLLIIDLTFNWSTKYFIFAKYWEEIP